MPLIGVMIGAEEVHPFAGELLVGADGVEMGLHPELAERAAARAGLDRRMVAALDVD